MGVQSLLDDPLSSCLARLIFVHLKYIGSQARPADYDDGVNPHSVHLYIYIYIYI